MLKFQRKTPWEKEWELLQKREIKFLEKRETKKDSILNQKLEEVVPEKLQETLNSAFAKAFALVFEKGTGVIEKTYNREKLEKDYQINRYMEEVRKNRKSLKTFSKKAGQSGQKNLLVSGVSGIGLGVLGIGIPDIPLFLGMVLKSIYEVALNYGYRYDTEEERYFILLLIEGAVSYGDDMQRLNWEADAYMEQGFLPADYSQNRQIERASAFLSKELLYMKFLQGIPLVGAVGGIYDAVYMKRILEYAGLKYKKRFLMDKKNR